MFEEEDEDQAEEDDLHRCPHTRKRHNDEILNVLYRSGTLHIRILGRQLGSGQDMSCCTSCNSDH